MVVAVLAGVLGIALYLWLVQVKKNPGGAEAPVPQAAEEPSNPKVGDVWVRPAGVRFRFVPSGTYTIGTPAGAAIREDNETQHPVALTRGVWLAETELTQAQWSRMVKDERPWYFKNCGPDCPVENVTWFAAAEFANRLSAEEMLPVCYRFSGCSGTLGGDYSCKEASFVGIDCPGYRLPTEAEWEVAARAVPAGSAVSNAIYTGTLTLLGENNAPELDPIAWYGGNSGVSYLGAVDCSTWLAKQYASKTCGPHPVGQRTGNAWGFRDLLGNVWEWAGDWYAQYPTDRKSDPLGPAEGSSRVIRGGSWYSDAQDVRAACRARDGPSSRWSSLGFRLARGQGLRSSTSR